MEELNLEGLKHRIGQSTGAFATHWAPFLPQELRHEFIEALVGLVGHVTQEVAAASTAVATSTVATWLTQQVEEGGEHGTEG